MREVLAPAAPSPWLTVEEASSYAKVGKRTVYGEVRRGALRAAKIGGRRELRFRKEWIDAWLESSATPQDVSARS